MAGKITNGISEITIGGEALGFTTEDSFSWDVDDNTSEQTFNVEEQDDPIFTRKTGSKILGFTFAIPDPDANAIKTLFDGTDIGTGGVELDGISNNLVKQEVIVVSEQGWTVTLTSADISATFEPGMGKNSLFSLLVTVRKNAGKITFVDPTDV